MPSRSRHRRGFTLLEISIVLIIVGLIIGGIMAGRTLIRAASVRAQVSQISSFAQAVGTFRVKFNAVPGDLKASRAVELGFLPRVGSAGCGDGNNSIEGITAQADIQTDCSTAASPTPGGSIGNEWFYVWADLSQAAFVNFGYQDSLMTTAGNKVTSNLSTMRILPSAKLGSQAGYIALGGGGGEKPLSFYFLSFSSGRVDGTPTPPLFAEDAFSYDSKVDDGLPNRGSVRVITPDNSANLNLDVRAPSNAPVFAHACYPPNPLDAFLGSIISPAYADMCSWADCITVDDGNGGCVSACVGGQTCNVGTCTDPYCQANLCETLDGNSHTCVSNCVGQQWCLGGSCQEPSCDSNACMGLDTNTHTCTYSCVGGQTCSGGICREPECGSCYMLDSDTHTCVYACVGGQTCGGGGCQDPDCASSCLGFDSTSHTCTDSYCVGGQGCINGGCVDPDCAGACMSLDENHNCVGGCVGEQSCQSGSCVDPTCDTQNCMAVDGGTHTCQSTCVGQQTCDGEGSCIGPTPDPSTPAPTATPASTDTPAPTATPAPDEAAVCVVAGAYSDNPAGRCSIRQSLGGGT